MSIKVGGVLAKLPHVEVVAPVITQISTAGALEVIAGIDLKSYESLSGGFHYLKAGRFKGPRTSWWMGSSPSPSTSRSAIRLRS